MATTTYHGPILAGGVRQGAVKNLGFSAMVQSWDVSEVSTSATRSEIVIPAHSRVINLGFYIMDKGFDSGTSHTFFLFTAPLDDELPSLPSANEYLVTGVPLAGDNNYITPLTKNVRGSEWVGLTDHDRRVWYGSNRNNTTARLFFTIKYLQSFNNVREF